MPPDDSGHTLASSQQKHLGFMIGLHYGVLQAHRWIFATDGLSEMRLQNLFMDQVAWTSKRAALDWKSAGISFTERDMPQESRQSLRSWGNTGL